MKNVNRDYLVKVDAKTADIIPPRDMKFYITDIYTCNIFFQLTINDTNSSFIGAPIEDASNYTLTLRVVKPNDTKKEIVADFMYQSGNAFYYVADLDPEFTDVIGICQCELLIETEVITEDGKRKEISTTEPFQYEVEKSIFSNLDEVIEGDPDYPLLIDTLATKDYVHKVMENMNLYGYATRDYVDRAMADINLASYATKDYINQVLVGGSVSLDGYVTDEELNTKADKGHTHSEYATRTELNKALGDIESLLGGI